VAGLGSVKDNIFDIPRTIRQNNSNILELFIYPTDAQLDFSKNINIYIKIFMKVATTCFGFLQPLSGNYYICFAKVISINNKLKYVVYRICSV
jgi:hypothetical protein